MAYMVKESGEIDLDGYHLWFIEQIQNVFTLYGKFQISLQISKNRFSQNFLFLKIDTWKIDIYLQQCFIDISPV